MFDLLPEIYVPAFELTVDHVPLPPEILRSVVEITVTERLDPPAQFGFRFFDPAMMLIDPAAGLITEGSYVEIKMGYVDATMKMITGEITALSVDLPDSGPPSVYAEGLDLLHRLTRGTTYRWFPERDSDIVKQLAEEMELKAQTDETAERTGMRAQNNITNLKMIEELAGANNFSFWIEEDKLFFMKERPAPNTLQLAWGKTLMSFSARLSLAGQVMAAEVRGWDEVQKQEVVGRAERLPSELAALAPPAQVMIAKGAGKSSVITTDAPGVTDAGQAQQMAENMLGEQRSMLLEASGVSVGLPDLHAGTHLELSGNGRFAGTYIAAQVTHTLGQSGYQTSFQARRKW